jgi:outer membrane protein assembly factor BamE (lipoprotein component of BamABCDE complex)
MKRSVQQLVTGTAAKVAVLALTGGCTTIKDHRGYLGDRYLIQSVEPGIDNRTSVERTLGRPTFVSQFGQQDWYYISISTSQKPFGRPKTYDETALRVRFDGNGNVAGVDRRGKEDVVRLVPNGNETPTLGRQRNILEDLFGNIGAVGTGGGAPAGGGGGGGGGTGPNGS